MGSVCRKVIKLEEKITIGAVSREGETGREGEKTYWMLLCVEAKHTEKECHRNFFFLLKSNRNYLFV